MRAWKVTEYGNPRDVLRLDENATLPDPGPGQIKIAVQAAGLGLPDVFSCHNNYPLTPPLPFTPSQEVTGTIIATGTGVNLEPGMRVLGPSFFQKQQGGLAEESIMSARQSFRVPDTMLAEEAAGFFIPYQTAWVGLIRRAQLMAAETLLVLGASGSSGSAAIQLAKAIGSRVIAVSGGMSKQEFCRKLGADEVIDHNQNDLLEAVMSLTDGKGVDVVFDPVGGDTGRAAFDAIAFEGRFVVIGFASGQWVNIHPVDCVMKNSSILGAMPTGFGDSYYQEVHDHLLDYWQGGKLRIMADQTFAFEEAVDAIEHIAARKVTGKVVVKL